MVGNGVTDDVIDGNALLPFVHGMGLISDELFEVCGLIVPRLLSELKVNILCHVLHQKIYHRSVMNNC